VAGWTDAPALIEVRALRRTLSPRFTLEVDEFTLSRGEKVAVVGQNGAGKTTFLRALAGLDAPTSCDLRTGPHRGEFGFLRQQPYLFRGSVARNLAYPLRLRRVPANEVADRVTAMCALLDLRAFAEAPVGRLSGGEQKRVALGRALIAQPAVVFLDEPDAYLDGYSLEIVARALEDSEATLLFASHDLRMAHRVGGRVIHLRDGILVPGLPANVLAGRVEGDRFVSAAGLRVRLGQAVAADPLKIEIDPRSLVISLEPLASSMLNEVRGRIAVVREHDGQVWLEIDCGDRLTAIISRDSYEKMGLNLNREVCVSFKANAVEVL
jgi:tungstate transport system ATP-binding protein